MAYGVEKLQLGWAVKAYGSMDAAIRAAESSAVAMLTEDEEHSDQKWAADYLAFAGKQPHSGDCSECRSWLRAPISCHACIYDDYMNKAWESLRANSQPQT